MSVFKKQKKIKMPKTKKKQLLFYNFHQWENSWSSRNKTQMLFRLVKKLKRRHTHYPTKQPWCLCGEELFFFSCLNYKLWDNARQRKCCFFFWSSEHFGRAPCFSLRGTRIFFFEKYFSVEVTRASWLKLKFRCGPNFFIFTEAKTNNITAEVCVCGGQRNLLVFLKYFFLTI